MSEHKNKSSYGKIYQNLYQWATGYLARYETNRYKLQAKLKEKLKKYEAHIDKDSYLLLCEEILQKLEEKNYLSDERYAKQRMRLLLLRGKSVSAIKYDLKKNGLDHVQIENTIEYFTQGFAQFHDISLNEFAAMRYIKKHALGAYRRKEFTDKIYQKEILSLQRQGFFYDIAQYVLNLDQLEVDDCLYKINL